jgi:hypothetical protein
MDALEWCRALYFAGLFVAAVVLAAVVYFQ